MGMTLIVPERLAATCRATPERHAWLKRMCQNSVHGGFARLIFPTRAARGPATDVRSPI